MYFNREQEERSKATGGSKVSRWMSIRRIVCPNAGRMDSGIDMASS